MSDKTLEVQETVPRFAASSVAAGGTTWAAHVIFSSTMLKGTTALDRPELVVSLPWPLAKALVEVLRVTVEQYEATEGEIQLPKSYVTKRDKDLQELREKPASNG